MSLNLSGTMIEIIKRIVEQSENPLTDSLCLDLSQIPNSLSGIASMHVAAVRTVLAQCGLSVFSTKEELLLRLFMHKYQPDLVFKTEKDALFDLVTIIKNVIMTQCQLDLASVTSERMFSSNKYTTTRKQTLNTEQIAPTVPHPAHLTCDTLQHLFTPLKEFITTNGKVERKKTKSFKSMTSVGSVVKVKWLREEVIGTGWTPGRSSCWYSGVVTAYNEATEQLEVEYLLEKGFKYTMDYTKMLTKDLLETSEPVLAKLEAYEKMTTVGQEIQIKLESMLGWQDALVVGAVEEDFIKCETAEFTIYSSCGRSFIRSWKELENEEKDTKLCQQPIMTPFEIIVTRNCSILMTLCGLKQLGIVVTNVWHGDDASAVLKRPE